MAPPKSPCQGGQQGEVNGQDWGVSYPKSHPSDYFQLGFIDLLGLREAAFFLFHYIYMCETSGCFCIRALQSHEHLLEQSLCAPDRGPAKGGVSHVSCSMELGAPQHLWDPRPGADFTPAFLGLAQQPAAFWEEGPRTLPFWPLSVVFEAPGLTGQACGRRAAVKL